MTTDSEAALEIGESGRPVAYERGLQAFMGRELFAAPGCAYSSQGDGAFGARGHRRAFDARRSVATYRDVLGLRLPRLRARRCSAHCSGLGGRSDRRRGAILLFEFGVGQDRQVQLLFERSGAYEAIQLFSNEQGQPRVITGRKKSHG